MSQSSEVIAPVVLDVTAGGGSIPLESARLGFRTIANDLNPVAALLLRCTVRYPIEHGAALISRFQELSVAFKGRVAKKLDRVFPQPSGLNERSTTYVWCRSMRCIYCEGDIPLSPSWALDRSGAGIRLHTKLATYQRDEKRLCEFEIVSRTEDHSAGTIAGTQVVCPYHDCGRVIDIDEVKAQGRSGQLGDRLSAVVGKRKVPAKGRNGRESWERFFRAPAASDDVAKIIDKLFDEKSSEWEALGCLPTERLPQNSETWTHGNTPAQYGATRFSDLFSKRQLITHCSAVETFIELHEEHTSIDKPDPVRDAAFVLLALSIDRMIDWNSRQCTWDLDKQSMAHTFQVHAFPIRWSYAEMDPLTAGLGYDWALDQTQKCLTELVQMTSHLGRDLFSSSNRVLPEILNSSGSLLSVIRNKSVDVIVMDPPYGANIMYSELSDYFYVWLRRTAGRIVPTLFTRALTDGDAEAVANKAKFLEKKGAIALANRDYQEKMGGIFSECRRVLKANGIITVMFTHKEAGAWDALTKGLMQGGFIVTASWPVNTEAEGSTHIKKKAAANSTIFLVCRPRPADQGNETTYWEDVEPLVAKAVRTRVEEFQKAGIGGVDLYLASFGPALEEFTRHWPLKRGTPRPEPLAKKRRKQAQLFEEEFDPYAVTPEDALDAARREVKTWRLNQLTHTKGRGDLDATTSWFVLAWDAFEAPVFSYDEGLRLARAVGADLEGQLIGRICEKKGSEIKLWDSATRAAKSGLGPADGSRAMIDAIHHAAHRGRTRTLDAALDLLKDAGIANDPQFLRALEAVLEVLPPSRNFVGFDVASGDAKSAADDFDALEKLRRLAFSDRIDEPQQLSLFAGEAA
jgi:putative DNA methylase